MKSLLLRLAILLTVFIIFFSKMPLHDKGTNYVPKRAPLPYTLIINSIGVKAAIEYVGLEKDGSMGVPRHGRDVAWYKLGARPGEKGSAVIDGHVDFVDGKPAVFYNLSKLKKGDTIIVVDALKKPHEYSVTETKMYEEKDVPLKMIFTRNDNAYLNLITCAGIYSETNQDYNKRVVVYSVLHGN